MYAVTAQASTVLLLLTSRGPLSSPFPLSDMTNNRRAGACSPRLLPTNLPTMLQDRLGLSSRSFAIPVSVTITDQYKHADPPASRSRVVRVPITKD